MINCINMDEAVRITLPAGLEPLESPTVGSKTWTSCCITLDKEFTMFFVKYGILIGLMVFFAVELHFAGDCSEQQLFMSMLTLIVGLAIPSPRLRN